MSTETKTNASLPQYFKEELDFTVTLTFSLAVPCLLFIVLYHKSSKTDEKHSHYPIHTNLVVLGTVHISVILVSSSIILISESFQNFIHKLPFFIGMHSITICIIKNFPLITITIFYHLLFLSSIQRIFLMFNAKLGTRTMTGRRLNLYIIMIYPLAIISAINKIMAVDKMPYLEIGVQSVTVIILIFNLFSVGHIERQPFFVVHKTALAQTAPLIFTLMTLTILNIYFLTTNNVNICNFQSFMAIVMSLATPLFLITGSSAKRRVVVNILTCRGHNNVVRVSYSAEHTPVTGSNVVSMVPRY